MNQEVIEYLRQQNDVFIRREDEKALEILWLKV